MHTNTKHQQEELKCEEKKILISFTARICYIYILKKNIKVSLKCRSSRSRESVLFASIEYNMNVKDHLDEIRYIDFDYLKNGCEIFDCC